MGKKEDLLKQLKSSEEISHKVQSSERQANPSGSKMLASRIWHQRTGVAQKAEPVKKHVVANTSRVRGSVAGSKDTVELRERLAGSQFRWINERLYTSSSAEAVRMMADEPVLYKKYHEGFRVQAAQWPVRPVEELIRKIRQEPRSWVIGDFGCGDAALAANVPQRVHSFDLVSGAPGVVAADMAHVPLENNSLDVAVYCLALMGTNLGDFMREAHRVLKEGGLLRIAEVSSRFGLNKSRCAHTAPFTRALGSYGFTLLSARSMAGHFELLEYSKTGPISKTPLPVTLKPCVYKRRG